MSKPKVPFIVCKPCWEIKYCPYGPLIEAYPLIDDEPPDLQETNATYHRILSDLADGLYETEDDVLQALDALEYWLPYKWELLHEFDPSDLKCNVFGHICPVFYHAEPLSETKEVRDIPKRYVPRDIMLKVVRRDGQICQKCHRHVPDDQLHFDHLIPFSRGGPTTVDNIRVLCAECNRTKSDSLSDILRDRHSDRKEVIRMAKVYRKRKAPASDTWHFCTDCSNWPKANYDEKTTRPTDGELCNECKAKEKKQECK